MDVNGKVAVVTGAGGGIGAALTTALRAAGASVTTTDLQGDVDVVADVSKSDEIERVLAAAPGPVDLYCANAGIGGEQGLGDDEAEWERIIDVNVLAHVRAARLLLPGWLERGSGYFVGTASAAGLLTQIGAAPYSVTKHAAVAFAEWLSVTYGDRGVGVSCLCPMGVNTNMLNGGLDAEDADVALGANVVAAAGEILEPEEVAAKVLEAIAAETFLVLPHAEVLDFYRRKGNDYDRWIRGMRRLQGQVAQA
ncbi:SDR family oxidoreductase [Baekduia sp. Peel2402]|uniref:SDR family oxidoreductase n=1 Tax=Baekduia sp. Peel2402 TaxID=3458296 RepID=UPI00403ED96B